MHTGVLGFALRHGLVGFETVAALARQLDRNALMRLGWGIAGSLATGQLVELLGVFSARKIDASSLRTELAARRRFAEALGDPPRLSFELLDQWLDVLEGSERDRWLASARSELARLFSAEDRDTLACLRAAKVALRFVPAGDRSPWVAWLREAYAIESAEGAYDELDYPYGEIDPGLELARTLAGVGEFEGAQELVAERDRRLAAFMNLEEVTECARLCGLLAEPWRERAHATFLRWARETGREAESRDVPEVRWHLHAPRVAGVDVEEELRRIVERAEMAEAIAEMLSCAELDGRLRDAARSRLVELAGGYVARLREVTRTGAVSDWAVHARSIRQLRAAAHALSVERDLPAPLVGRARAVAREWSSWIGGQGIDGDSLPHVYTGIAFGVLCRDEISEAVACIEALRRGDDMIALEYDGWEHLFSPERAARLAREAITRG